MASLEVKLQSRIQALTVERENIHRIESELSELPEENEIFIGAGGDADVISLSKKALAERSEEEAKEILEKKQS